jgi:hypothetical protein
MKEWLSKTTIFEEPTSAESPLVFQARFHRRRKGCRTILAPDSSASTHPPSSFAKATEDKPLTPRPCRVALTLSLAYKLEQAIAEGRLRSRNQAAELLGITSCRVSQNMDLLLLAPDIQEELLRMETIDGREPIAQVQLRPLMKLRCWEDQRQVWRELLARS